MRTILERTRKNGKKSFTAQIRIKRNGKIIHSEAQTFERKAVATAWLKKRETELAVPGALEAAGRPSKTLADAIDLYIEESRKAMGKTKAQVLSSIKGYPIAEMECARIRSDDIVEFAKTLLNGRQPQTVGNYLSHLAAIFAIARPAWGIELEPATIKDAQIVAKRLGMTSKSRSRDRRPTLDELERILTHYTDRQQRAPGMNQMVEVILFALFSTRRQEEITRITWNDLDRNGRRILVRDMKNPGEKSGNHVWCDLPAPALEIAVSMPEADDRIFPYSADAISASFTRACQFLGIEDLHFHDMRHEGISRLFEMGWNIPHVAGVSGHRSWNSLKRYTHMRSVGDKYEGWAWIADYIGNPT